MKGIDVSVSQGKIDWEKVKSEVDFAILRCGYGSDIAEQDDKQWLYNVAECERLGIPWGVYLYSYAMSLDEADSEAAHVLRLLKGRKPALPVYLDMEDADGYKAKRGGISRSLATDICVRFCEKIKAAGYIPGVYANLDWTRNHLDMDRLSGYEFWIAQYNDVCTYTGSYGLWQYTSKGRIDGVSGNVDMNIMYKDYLKPRADVSWDTAQKSLSVGGEYSALCTLRNSEMLAVRTTNPEVVAIVRHQAGYVSKRGQTGDLYTIRAIAPGEARIIAATDGDSASFPVTAEGLDA